MFSRPLHPPKLKGIIANRENFAPTIQANVTRHHVRDDEAALIHEPGAPAF